eukprot:Hpha_TRINITY_DN11802_c1_g1::TRINITY_DN11802_c1_g1_i2::g.2005::m.2005
MAEGVWEKEPTAEVERSLNSSRLLAQTVSSGSRSASPSAGAKATAALGSLSARFQDLVDIQQGEISAGDFTEVTALPIPIRRCELECDHQEVLRFDPCQGTKAIRLCSLPRPLGGGGVG